MQRGVLERWQAAGLLGHTAQPARRGACFRYKSSRAGLTVCPADPLAACVAEDVWQCPVAGVLAAGHAGPDALQRGRPLRQPC